MSNEATFKFVLTEEAGPTQPGRAVPVPPPLPPTPPPLLPLSEPQGSRLSQVPTVPPKAAPVPPPSPAPTAPAGKTVDGKPGYSTAELAELLGKSEEEVRQEFGLPEEAPIVAKVVDEARNREQDAQRRALDERYRQLSQLLPARVGSMLRKGEQLAAAAGGMLATPVGAAAAAVAGAGMAGYAAAKAGVGIAEELAPGLAEVNAEVAAAKAMQEVQALLNRIETGRRLGGDVAEVLGELTAISKHLTAIRNEFLKPLLAWTADVMNLVEEPLEFVARFIKQVEENETLRKALWEAIKLWIPALRNAEWAAKLGRWLDNDEAKKGTNLMTWFEALPHITPSNWEGAEVRRSGFTAEEPGLFRNGMGEPEPVGALGSALGG